MLALLLSGKGDESIDFIKATNMRNFVARGSYSIGQFCANTRPETQVSKAESILLFIAFLAVSTKLH